MLIKNGYVTELNKGQSRKTEIRNLKKYNPREEHDVGKKMSKNREPDRRITIIRGMEYC